MIKFIRKPAFFITLSFVLSLWITSMVVPGSPIMRFVQPERVIHFEDRYSYRIPDLIRNKSPVVRHFRKVQEPVSPFLASIGPGFVIDYAVLHRQAVRSEDGAFSFGFNIVSNVDRAAAVSEFDICASVTEFGLLSTCAIHERMVLHNYKYAGYPKIKDDDLISGLRTCTFTFQGEGGEKTLSDILDRPSKWSFYPRAIINDSLFLLTLIAWLISLTAIHRWPIWKRITPAQRRRAENQCQTCAYDLAGLTTPTCPECGSTTT